MSETQRSKEILKPQLAAIIFDLDGLLIDSEPLWSEGRLQLLSHYGVSYNSGDKKKTMGRDYREGVTYIINQHSLPLTVDEYADKEKQILDRLYEQRLKLMPGVEDFLKIIDRMQIPSAIATSSSRKRLDFAMRLVKLKGFTTTVTGDEINKGKPAPDIFLKAAEKLGVESGGCIVLEDSPFGIMAARNAGMHSVAVYDPRFTSEEDFTVQARPDLIVESLSKLNFEKLKAIIT